MFEDLYSQAVHSTAAEAAAVVLAIVYLVLAVRENIWCWAAGFVSTSIFLVIFWQVNLYMESGLQVYYLGMAVYGWYQWRQPQKESHYLPISTWTAGKHILSISGILTLTLIFGFYLATYTDARLPYLDSFTTCSAVVTTYMVTQKILENWIYWLVIDSASIYLYLDRSLFFTAFLFAVYIVIIFFGWYSWWKTYRRSALPSV